MRRLLLTLLFIGLALSARSQQTIVFPAVTDEVEGLNGSRWITVVRIIKVDPRDTITVKRKWVCLPDGGFMDDPEDPPTFHMWPDQRRYRISMQWGNYLLYYTGSQHGAIAFEIDGGHVLAHSYVVDISKGLLIPEEYTAGQGQFIRAMEEPLVGPSHIPWLGGCLNAPCSNPDGNNWNFHRNNIGLVNPNSEPLTVTGVVIPFSTWLVSPEEIDVPEPESFTRTLPPYGWLQFPWLSDRHYGLEGMSPILPTAGFVISLTPDKDDLPYYAYASVVFSPDPDSDNQMFSDPMFVPAEPGYVAPWAEVYPPKGDFE